MACDSLRAHGMGTPSSTRPTLAPLPTFDDAAASVPFLTALTAVERERLRPHARLRRITSAAAIWREEDASGELLFVIRGRVKLARTTESGRDVILDTCRAGDALCIGLLATRARYCCSALPLHGPVDVLGLPRAAVLQIIDDHPAVARALLHEAARREKGLARRIEELSSGHVERRVAALLARLAEQVGAAQPGGETWLPVTLSRQDLADLCGTTLETVIRTMTRLGRSGLVRTVEGGFRIADLRRLQAVAQGRASS
jgi:CRP-like cAMP-binding protein